MNFEHYITDFNTGDDERLVEKYYHPDIIFTGSTRKLHGKAGAPGVPQLGPQRHPRDHPGPKLRPAGQQALRRDRHGRPRLEGPAELPVQGIEEGRDDDGEVLRRLHIRPGRQDQELKSATWPAEYEVTKP
jgi:hypothetical protein